MFTRIFFCAAFAFVALLATPIVHAQSASDVQAMLDRMQTIMSEMQKLQAEFQELTAQVTADSGSGAVLGAQTSAPSASPVFTESLEFGETNDDIARIQRLLSTDPEIYDHPYVTGYFGPKTEEAIMNLQERFGYERVGVIGPATTAMLEGWMRAYPDENYPDGVLSTKPTVLGASTSNTDSSGQLASLQDRLAKLLAEDGSADGDTAADDTINRIEVEFISDEAYVDVYYSDRRPDAIELETDDENDVIDEVADELGITTDRVEELISFERRNSGTDDEDDAEDAIEDAEDAIDEADEEIEEAEEDGDETDWAEDTLDEAEDELEKAEEAFEDEDWDEAVEHAEEAEELAEKAMDRIDEEEDEGDSDEVHSIEVEVLGDDEAEVVVEYGDGDEEEFDVDEDRKEDIIAEVADELDMDEDDVEDLIEFDYGDIDEIEVFFENNRTRVEVVFENGIEMRIMLDEDLDEDEVIEEVAEELDVRESVVEDVIDF